MPPKIKISSFDLLSQVEEAKEKFTQQKKNGWTNRVSKKPIIKQNKGVGLRVNKDTEAILTDDHIRVKMALERKSRLYEKMQRGDMGEGPECLIDFSQKWEEEKISRNEEEEEEEEEDLVETTDEFGRCIWVPAHQATRIDQFGRVRMVGKQATVPYGFCLCVFLTNSENVIRGDHIQAAPNLDDKKMKEILEEPDTVPEVHYDGTREIRTKGVAFYQFSQDEELRQQQMADLQSARAETEYEREMNGAIEPETRRIDDPMERLERELKLEKKGEEWLDNLGL
ncbi:hypothetical protein NEOLI_002940 [Neolecta irregularis DAH-3]|uniref:Uncharacterized protein n=1 Tax=Neolecta irregularis (strain DAH-3) TaxID=1198029 RepID=A0A1U7LSC3_NEOID|nr:hypothetical protein NEOLI_002940 [Neolecta irregularis DAH-3]|eukprot:OLL25442.1 hypothetical protein NEOLI_002940 [Neolecta irregularis DAH-3]